MVGRSGDGGGGSSLPRDGTRIVTSSTPTFLIHPPSGCPRSRVPACSAAENPPETFFFPVQVESPATFSSATDLSKPPTHAEAKAPRARRAAIGPAPTTNGDTEPVTGSTEVFVFFLFFLFVVNLIASALDTDCAACAAVVVVRAASTESSNSIDSTDSPATRASILEADESFASVSYT